MDCAQNNPHILERKSRVSEASISLRSGIHFGICATIGGVIRLKRILVLRNLSYSRDEGTKENRRKID